MMTSMITIATDKGFNKNNGNDVMGNDHDVDGNGATDDDIDNNDCGGMMEGDNNKYD